MSFDLISIFARSCLCLTKFKTMHIISFGKGTSLICLYNIKLDDSNSTSHTIPHSINIFWIPWVKRSIVLVNEALSKLAWLENIVWWGMNVFGLLNFIACILIQSFWPYIKYIQCHFRSTQLHIILPSSKNKWQTSDMKHFKVFIIDFPLKWNNKKIKITHSRYTHTSPSCVSL